MPQSGLERRTPQADGLTDLDRRLNEAESEINLDVDTNFDKEDSGEAARLLPAKVVSLAELDRDN